MRALLSDIATCLGFYTRLPVPAGWQAVGRFARAQWAAPVAGFAVGLIVAAALWLGGALGLSPQAAAAAALGLSMLATGALHEDGLADVADGFGGGRTRHAKLAIMKDSRIGAYGTLALIVTVLIRWSALAALASAGGPLALLALPAAHAASRALLPAFMMALPPARGDGLSAGIAGMEARTALAALALGFLVLLPGGVWFALAASLLLALWFLALAALSRRQIGGQTGDVLGTLQQGGEIAVLLCASTLLA
ncbi:adenosylcobinamide-GDP ribazoletransferase [Aureimonas populi]|uniref:Adenosylcobinamide-GDP ribazoletransferase n=1 Tax=Aureimonas populi TaxID=1701758 RepID=A0ABW5CHW5_9HYPH|nr:adenosylcobinamide-GDP ribazoletransferase [Aureimonas populi]